MQRRLVRFMLVAGLAAGALSAPMLADDLEPVRDGYSAGTYGRIRYQDNGVTIVRSTATEAGENVDTASVNDAIFPGDSVRTRNDSRAEAQLASGTLVRIDRGTDVTFLSLPDPYAEIEDNTILEVSHGAIQLSATTKNRQEFRVDTPSATVYLLGDGEFRVEVADGGTTRVLSRRGVAEVTGEGASVLVRGGTRTVVDPGAAPLDPRPFHSFSADDFDAWVASRTATYEVGDRAANESDVDAYDQVPAEVRPYYRELSDYGRWVYTPAYGYAWYPSGMAPGWRPYMAGGWSYGPGGYFWVSSEPWGWAPYHYGRWSWVSSYGWCWLPGSVFGGAWVSWSWGASHVGWCALDYWNRPAYHGSWAHSHYDPGSWTVVGYKHFGSRDCRRYAVPVDQVGGLLQTSAVVTRAPRASPRALIEDPAARRKAISEATTERGVRTVAGDTRARTPGRSFFEVERKDLRPSIRRTTTGAVPAAPPRERARIADRPPASTSTERRRPEPRPAPSRGPLERAPIRERTEPRRVARAADAPPQVEAQEGSPRVVQQSREGRPANENVRELYRRAAGPRVAGERPAREGVTPRVAPRPKARIVPAPSAGPRQGPASSAPAPAARAPGRAAPPPKPAPQKPSASGTRGKGHEGKKK